MIRPSTSSDKPQLLELLDLNTPLYFASSEEQDFILYLAGHLEAYFVVEKDGKIIGCGGINYFAGQTERDFPETLYTRIFREKALAKSLRCTE